MPGGEVIVGGPHIGILPDGWERSQTESGIPYYLDHQHGTTQWEHPNVTRIFEQLNGMSNIKYAAYRTAMKLRTIQKTTQMNAVTLLCIDQTFRQRGLFNARQNSAGMSVAEVESLLNEIFKFTHQKRNRTDLMQPDSCVELTLNWILKCIDSGRTGIVKVHSLKIVMAALCSASLEDKYSFMYHQVFTEHSTGISQHSLKTLLQDLLLLTQNVSESNTFASENIEDAVANCWREVKLQPTDVLSEKEFIDWMKKEPICIVWLPTLHRLSTAETIKHEAKCSKCKAFPIIGFRYRCLKCTNLDLCQNCFWTHQELKNHKASHPTREYCLATTTGDDVRDFTKQLKYKITRKYRRQPPKKTYLDYPMTKRTPEEQLPEQSPVFQNVHTRVNCLAARLQELEGTAQQTTQPVQVVQVEHQPPPTITRPTEEEVRAREHMQRHINRLQEEKQHMQAKMKRMAHLLQQKESEPSPSRIMPTPPAVLQTPTLPEMKSQAVNTQDMMSESQYTTVGSQYTAVGSFTALYGSEEQEIDTMLRELLAAFPTETTETIASDINTELFRTAERVGTSLGDLVEQVDSRQQGTVRVTSRGSGTYTYISHEQL